MSQVNKASLEKLLLFISEICDDDANLWFRDQLALKINKPNVSEKNIDSIYEYCIKEIIKDQAKKFYTDLKLTEIKPKLIEDFVRMEQFKREDNFEDFCLAMFQQTENIVNYLFDSRALIKKTKNHSSDYLISRLNTATKEFKRDTRGITVGNFLFNKYTDDPIDLDSVKWYYNNKLRAVLYFIYFNEIIEYSTKTFENLNYKASELYQMRNKNHRGTKVSDYQGKMYAEIVTNHNKYYFKFLGFLEVFVSGLNKNL